ncbi:acyltransferase family protein [Ottowia sp.]|uniref:acyltransferase family protein n=1 Tax=Ottowia sp. TaxID=1898956 RepID=UPI002C0F66A7|nr:acyltransferase [Ottowia sp.]
MTTATSPSRFARDDDRRVVFLDYLRIFAFVSVLVGHKFAEPLQAAMADPTSPGHRAARLSWPWVQGGGVGVLVFFLVSGYVITQVLQRERTAEFLVKRAFRIYPLYVTAVLMEAAGLWGMGKRPDWHELGPQLLLIGDWTGTPYALGGVEWTLRMEVGFYVFMALLQAGGAVRWRQGVLLPALYAAMVVGLFWLGPWPTHQEWTRGYGTLYFPFLLLGSVLWLREHRVVGWVTLAAFGLLVFVLHDRGLHAWQPRWLDAGFAQRAVALFVLLWTLRPWLPAGAGVLWWSGLTYAVYLLHYWMFDWFRNAAGWAGAGPVAAQGLALLALLVVCAALVRSVEQPAIGAGRRLARRLGYGKGGA